MVKLSIPFTDVPVRWIVFLFVVSSVRGVQSEETEEDYYRLISIATSTASTDSRSPQWRPNPEGVPLEVSGIAVLDQDEIAVAIRKGEIWILRGIGGEDPRKVTYRRFASGLHEPLGLLWHQGSFYTAQRSELTRLRDLDGDGMADDYRTVADGWGLTGHYHEYAYGPKLDGKGNLWLTLNIGLGLKGDQLRRTIHEPKLNVRQAKWRGWGLIVKEDGTLLPQCAGMRSPSGLGTNSDGEMFYTDQQGNWVGTNALHHMRLGSFSHHPESLASIGVPGSPISDRDWSGGIPDGIPYPLAIEKMKVMKPPAVWFPYKKAGQSATDIQVDASGGKFGPFANQLFVGEFTLAGIHRVFLERVDGEYQGACFPFRRGLASAVLRLAQGTDGSLFAGLTNRGWSSVGSASYGLQRLVWTGKVPFEILEMRSRPDGFELRLTQPVDPQSALDPRSYTMSSYTYTYQSVYGSDEIQKQSLKIERVEFGDDDRTIRLKIAGLRPYFVHELKADGVRSSQGVPLLHTEAYYTLNRIPSE